LRRVAQVVRPSQTFSVVTKSHERFYSGQPFGELLVQPCNRGTGPAILYSLMRLRRIQPRAVVGFFPSDHHFADEEAFSGCLRQAFDLAEKRLDTVVLLGIKPSHPETGYGWIEPGEPLGAPGSGPVFGVRAFWEKPAAGTTAELIRRGCFWNSFIMIGSVDSFLNLVRKAMPVLLRSFLDFAPALFAPSEEARARSLYQDLESSSFSQDVLSVCPGKLAVLCDRSLEWVDVGEVDRALAVIESGSVCLPREDSLNESVAALAATATG